MGEIPELKTEVLNVRLRAVHRQKVETLARMTGCTLSQVVVELIDQAAVRPVLNDPARQERTASSVETSREVANAGA